MKKIKMILTNSFKEDIRVLKEANTLTENGYEVEVLCWDRENECLDKSEEILNKIKVKRFYPISTYGSGIKQIIPFFKFIFQVRRYLKNKDYDIIHAHDLDGLITGKLATFMKEKIFIYDSHEFFSGYKSNKIEKKIYYIEKIFLSKKDFIITVSESIAEKLKNFYNPKAIEIIKNAPYFKKIILKNNLLREEFKIENGKIILLYQGGIIKNRGLKELVEIIEKLDNNYNLVFIGKGNYKKELQTYVKNKKIEYKIFFKDFVENNKLLDYTNSADIGIYFIENKCLNHYYCLPNKVFEFIQGEIPVITSNFPDLERLIMSNKIGLAVNPNDLEEIVNSIKKITEDKENYVENIKESKKNLSWETEEKKLLNFYERIIEE